MQVFASGSIFIKDSFLALYPFSRWKVNSLTGKVLKSGKQECFKVFSFGKKKVFKEGKKKKQNKKKGRAFSTPSLFE